MEDVLIGNAGRACMDSANEVKPHPNTGMPHPAANRGSTLLTITEGNEVFAVSPSGNQRDIYDARWIKLFNGGSPYYQVNRIDANSRPRREINRTNNANKNYVQDVCNKAN